MTFSGKNKNIKKVEDEVLVELNIKTRILKNKITYLAL